MGSLKSFRAVLQDTLNPDDSLWTYTVPNLPKASQTNSSSLIKCISVVSSDSKQSITLRLDSPPSNRVTRNETLDRLLLISFSDFRLRWPPTSDETLGRLGTARETAEYIRKLLVTGLILNGVQYHFFGHSNSQLKSRSCFMYAATKDEISKKIEAMGDLSKLKSVGKKAKRIGLLFSSADMALTLSPDRCEDIEDVKINDYIFTDGCGLISHQLAKQLVQRRNIVHRGRRYCPSVFQIRYRGYKGVLTLDKNLEGKVQAQFRESMRKFKDASDHSFSVVDYSKPYAFGYLNDEVVVLLHALGISEETLVLKQAQHLHFLENVRKGDSRAAFQFLSYCDRIDLAERILFGGVEPLIPTLQSLVKQEYTRMLNKRDEQRCRILIPKSRLLFGVCDPCSKGGIPGKLKEGECFVRITSDTDGLARTIINTEVLVTRNPCLHPGDLQKFKAVDVPDWTHLVDCIVFPTRGKRPSADLMSGGDLDGDKFFVTWDPDIIPKTVSEAASYPGVKEFATFNAITDDDRAEYFARYTNASLGRVKNLYMKWARLKNAMSPECQELNRLFSQCVDGNRIKVPPKLEDPPNPPITKPPFVLDVLHQASTHIIQSVSDGPGLDFEEFPDVMDLLLSRDKIAMSEFELLQLTLRWCNRNQVDVSHYAQFFNFGVLSDEQQIWFLNQLPPSATLPSVVRNGLLQSDLVHIEELRRFNLDHPRLHWKPVFNSTTDRMGRFISTMSRTLELFHKKIIVLKVDERLTLAIYVPQKIQRASEVQVDTNVRVFALPRSQGTLSPNYRVLPTKANYRLYCDDGSFQLYELKRANTWIYMVRSQFNDESFRNEKDRGNRRRKKESSVEEGLNYDCRISVALQKISSDIQKHVGRMNRAGVLAAEIYVISNRDVKSMHYLDQWLELVDTEEILPLFEDLVVDYKIPTLENMSWDGRKPTVTAIARDGDLSQLRHVDSASDFIDVLTLLNDHGEKIRLREVYVRMLSLEEINQCPINPNTAASALLEFLSEATFLIPVFLKSQTWSRHKQTLEDMLINLGPTLLSQLILAANDLQSFVIQPLSLLLRELKQISLQSFAELVELIALSVRSSEMALDLLYQILEAETSRLLVGRPLAHRQFIKSLYGIALDHIDEASNNSKAEKESFKLTIEGRRDGYIVVKCLLRIDSAFGSMLKVGDHVRLTVTNPPQNAPVAKPFSMDALVLEAEQGSASLRCLHAPPSYVDQCAWRITHCGSFVTSKTMFDAVTAFYTQREACCRIYALLAGFPDADQIKLPNVELPVVRDGSLNQTQNDALEAAMSHALTLIWGPPGTGKTHTVAVILAQLVRALPNARILVTAPTHNAVDNLMRRCITDRHIATSTAKPLRVSTQLSKVASDLRSYTCDAMVGKDLSANFPARRQAQKRVKESRLIFSTCAGAGLGLLRTESFDVVLVDEASQQTEPATLIPLVKGCSRAILVGDHVQLRATVQKNAILADFDVSLFERHYNMPERKGIARVMLDTQYRMHKSLCDFSSTEFYNGRLETAVPDDARPVPPSQFPWPKDNRLIFIECASPEDLGRQSKANAGQVEVCKRVISLLKDEPVNLPAGGTAPTSIAILTPYTRQKQALQSSIPNIEVASIDGYQGREANIIVYVTVRSNLHGDTGFLSDMRRLNVVMTRAKVGAIIIGNKSTLTEVSTGLAMSNEEAGDVNESKKVWGRLIKRCTVLGVDSIESVVKG